LATVNHVGVQPRGRYFYFLIAVLLALLVFLGFARTFFLNSFFAKRDLSALYMTHGIVFTSWILLFITQTWLIASDRVAVHRRFGVAGAVLAVLMIVVGLTIAIHAARYGFQTPGLPPPLIFFVVPLFDILVFAILVGSALYYRHTPATHKRLMLVAAISMLPPAIARIPLHFLAATLPISAFAIADLILIGCVVYDVVIHRKLHRAFLWGGLLFIISFPLRMFLAGTAAWMAFAHWIAGV